MNHCYQFQVMSGVVHLMLSQLPGWIGHYSSFLHKNTSETLLRCITIDREVLGQIWQNQYWGCSQSLLQLLKVSMALSDHTNLAFFFNRDVISLASLENPSMNLL
jgi:hypothetical protein